MKQNCNERKNSPERLSLPMTNTTPNAAPNVSQELFATSKPLFPRCFGLESYRIFLTESQVILADTFSLRLFYLIAGLPKNGSLTIHSLKTLITCSLQ